MYTLLIVENKYGVIESIYVEQNIELELIEKNLYQDWTIIEVQQEVVEIPQNVTEYKMKDIKIYM